MRWCIGIEIGGTKLQIALGRGEGEPFRHLVRKVINPERGALGIQNQIVAGIDELLQQTRVTREQVAGIGIGFGGPVDVDRGVIVTSHQVAGWDQFPLVKWFEADLGYSTILQNDADTAAFAEAMFGAGRGFDPVMYVTVGSGIGGGLVCGGKIFRGCGAGAMEIGHMRPGTAPRHVAYPAATVEAIASGFGIEERAQRAIADWEKTTVFVDSRFERPQPTEGTVNTDPSAIAGRTPERCAVLLKLAGNDRKKITTRLIAQAASQGDRLSRELLADATETLGWAIAQAITLVNPARIVIGGGVSLIGQELFFEPVRNVCRAETFGPFAKLAEIVPAALGEEVVVHGALALARQAFVKEPNLQMFQPENPLI